MSCVDAPCNAAVSLDSDRRATHTVFAAIHGSIRKTALFSLQPGEWLVADEMQGEGLSLSSLGNLSQFEFKYLHV